MSAKSRLQILLIVFGGTAVVAVLPMVMPWSWMVAVHEWLGLGPLPHRPVVEYLARATSGLCAFYGGLLLVLATDVVRYIRIIAYQAVALLILSAASIPLNFGAGMPAWWVIGEAGGNWVFCGGMLWLVYRVRRDESRG